MKNYLPAIDLNVQGVARNLIVERASRHIPEILNETEIEAIYSYAVPAPSDNGACALKAKDPYDLRKTLGLESLGLAQHPETLRLGRLNKIITELQALTGVDWLGVYRTTTNLAGESILLKEAYYGRFSRAEFPLTEAFAKNSNNSTVGLSKKAILVQSIKTYEGPYYTCDRAVQSEFCLPILSPNGALLGIIDAEAFTPDFFTDEKILEIVKVAYDLGCSDLVVDAANASLNQ